METVDDWIDAETWKKGWEVEWASLAKWRRECELKFSPPPKPPSVWSRIGDGLEVAALWLVVLVLYFCVIMGAVFWSCRRYDRPHCEPSNFATLIFMLGPTLIIFFASPAGYVLAITASCAALRPRWFQRKRKEAQDGK